MASSWKLYTLILSAKTFVHQTLAEKRILLGFADFKFTLSIVFCGKNSQP